MQDERLQAQAYGSFLARAAAFLLDWAIVLVLSAILADVTAADDTGRVVIAITILSLYHIGFLNAMSTTPGKMALRLHVCDAAGKRLEPDRAITRVFVFLFTAVTLFGIPVSAAMLLLDPERRSLHDRLANTRVRSGRPDFLPGPPQERH
jgi:uncharacterized RDD family membrane protein YckC